MTFVRSWMGLTTGPMILILSIPLLVGGRAARAQGGDSSALARAEMQAMADAETASNIRTRFFVSLETLNDLPTSGSISGPYDYINLEGGTFVIPPLVGLIDPPLRINLLANPDPNLRWPEFPFITYQQGRVQDEPGFYELGTPLDPWGNPYLLFTPLGLVRGDIGRVTFELYGDFYDDYRIVSLGPDGVLGGGPTGSLPGGDDIDYAMAGGVQGPVISSIRDAPAGSFVLGADAAKAVLNAAPLTVTPSPDGSVFHAEAGDAIAVKGYGLGSGQGSHVLFGLVELSDVRFWYDNMIILVLPEDLLGRQELTVEIGGQPTNFLVLEIDEVVTAARHWERYR
jgi:hypothetical protein